MDAEDKKPLSMKLLDEQLNATNARLDDMGESVSELSDKVDTKMDEVLQSIKAINQITSLPNHGRMSTDYDYGENPEDIVFKDGRPEDDVELVRSSKYRITDPEFKEKAEQMQFDNELIQIMVMPSAEKFPDHTFTVGVNGRMILIVRGAKQWVPRCYVEVIARAKVSSYSNIEYRNEQNELAVKNPETKAARYPFQVVRDDSEKGPQWLERVMNEAA